MAPAPPSSTRRLSRGHVVQSAEKRSAEKRRHPSSISSRSDLTITPLRRNSSDNFSLPPDAKRTAVKSLWTGPRQVEKENTAKPAPPSAVRPLQQRPIERRVLPQQRRPILPYENSPPPEERSDSDDEPEFAGGRRFINVVDDVELLRMIEGRPADAAVERARREHRRELAEERRKACRRAEKEKMARAFHLLRDPYNDPVDDLPDVLLDQTQKALVSNTLLEVFAEMNEEIIEKTEQFFRNEEEPMSVDDITRYFQENQCTLRNVRTSLGRRVLLLDVAGRVMSDCRFDGPTENDDEKEVIVDGFAILCSHYSSSHVLILLCIFLFTFLEL